ncbi:MAG: ATP-binding protein [Deltaproteobacteria bacterium]
MDLRTKWLQQLLSSKENEHLEFKEAKNRFDFEELVKYCAALANEGGGKVVLGVSDRVPRKVVGSAAFSSIERTKAGLIERLRLRIDVEEISHSDGRILVFHIPSRPLGMPVSYKGAYWMRGGEDLVAMTVDQIRRILEEAAPDYSAEICPGASLADLEQPAIEDFRKRWMKKSKNDALQNLTEVQLLADAELIVDKQVSYAALILFGSRKALGKLLPQAEIIFEYRSTETTGPAQQRLEYRQGFFGIYDALWNTINLRNDLQHFQDGLFIWDIPTFSEEAIREAILNAVSHRDYRSAGSVFIRQYPRKLEIVSPGGLPQGITPENILWRQYPRNRRIAEAFARCGLVERSGQGMNRIYEECIKANKPKPDFAGTDAYNVSLTLNGEVQDAQFLRFLEKVGRERLKSFSTKDFLIVDHAFRGQPVPADLKERLPFLIEEGVIERIGRDKYTLSRQFFQFLGKKAVYTRRRGLDRETNKALLLRHIQDNRIEGSKFCELKEVLPALSESSVKRLLLELRKDGYIHVIGRTNAGKWHPVPMKNKDSHYPKGGGA